VEYLGSVWLILVVLVLVVLVVVGVRSKDLLRLFRLKGIFHGFYVSNI
jgi:hypothetical protein